MRRGRDELVLEAVELEQALVLIGELGIALPRLDGQALDHQTRDRCDGGENEGASPAGLRILGWADERERYQLCRRHRGEDHSELAAPGGDGEPEHR